MLRRLIGNLFVKKSRVQITIADLRHRLPRQGVFCIVQSLGFEKSFPTTIAFHPSLDAAFLFGSETYPIAVNALLQVDLDGYLIFGEVSLVEKLPDSPPVLRLEVDQLIVRTIRPSTQKTNCNGIVSQTTTVPGANLEEA